MVDIIPVHLDAPDETAVRRAAEALLRGETVALPTDTIYGLCARAEDPAAIEPQYHSWVGSRVPWLRIDDELPRYTDEGPGSPTS